MSRHAPKGFTLVELLVVITIIAVLLALLTPALDKAVYEAELAVCAGNMNGAVASLHTYAAEYRRQYPYRGSVRNAANTQQHLLSLGDNPDFDLRPVIRDYIPINKLLVDPTCLKVDLEGSKPRTIVACTYDLWFGWRYAGGAAAQRERGSFKVGDRWTWLNDSFNLVISDRNVREPGVWSAASSHDDLGVLAARSFQDFGIVPLEIAVDLGIGTPTTVSYWGAQADRGRIDMNHGYEDGSVDRLRQVDPIDPRTIAVPHIKQPGGNWVQRATYIWRK